MDPLHSVQEKKKDPEPIHCQAHHKHDEQNHILYSQSNSVAQCHQIKSKAPHIYHKSIFEWGVYMLLQEPLKCQIQIHISHSNRSEAATVNGGVQLRLWKKN